MTTDRIYLRDLVAECVIGVEREERDHPQQVCINVRLSCDLDRAAQTDALPDTVDYKALKDAIVERVRRSRFFLIERLAGEVAALCLDVPGVEEARVTVDKPGALTGTRSVAVELTRRRRRAP